MKRRVDEGLGTDEGTAQPLYAVGGQRRITRRSSCGGQDRVEQGKRRRRGWRRVDTRIRRKQQ